MPTTSPHSAKHRVRRSTAGRTDAKDRKDADALPQNHAEGHDEQFDQRLDADHGATQGRLDMELLLHVEEQEPVLDALACIDEHVQSGGE